MSSITGPSLGSEPPRTILPMEVARVLRYTHLVELSRTILLALMLEILGVILSTAGILVGVLLLSHVGSGILVQVAVSIKPWGGVEGCTTTNAQVDGNVGTVGAPGKLTGG